MRGTGPYPKKLCVLFGEPQAQTVAKLARSEKITWKPVVLAEGSKGPITAKVARIRVYVSRDGLPEEKPQWLFIRQTLMASSNMLYPTHRKILPSHNCVWLQPCVGRLNNALKKAKTKSGWMTTNIDPGRPGIVI
jgi:hypothetical protein